MLFLAVRVVDLLGDRREERTHEDAEAFDYLLHRRHRRISQPAMLDRRSDRLESDTEPRELLAEPALGQHEKRIDTLSFRLRDHREIKARGDVGKARPIRRSEIAFIDSERYLLLAAAPAIAGNHREARDFRDSRAVEL